MAEPRSALARARALMSEGKDQDAAPLLLQAARVSPRDADLLITLSLALSRVAQHEQAEYHARRAVALAPGSAGAHARLGEALAEGRRFEEACDEQRRAVALAPDDPDIAAGACMTLHLAGCFTDAVTLARTTLERFSDHPYLAARLSDSLNVLGRVSEAVSVLRQARARNPDVHFLATDLCAASTFDPTVDARESLAIHQEYARLVARLYPTPPPARWDLERDPDRVLRLAVVSPDLRSHPVATFFEPLASHVDRARLEITCYYTGHAEDDVSRRLRSLVPRWRHIPARSASAAARAINERVRADQIDVLLECSGHSERNLLPLCRLRPAPVQITGLGWPNTTGLPEIGWRITDSAIDPPGSEPWSTERPMRLDPCYLCYQPLRDAPHPGPPPHERLGMVTFGCFNAGPKLNDEVLAVFARVLAAVEGSRLLLKHSVFRAEQGRDAVRARFRAVGAPIERIEMLGPTPHREHLEAHQRVDIALDPFPFNGATTTCDAMFMGVPVVTLRSERIGARVGASLLGVVGLSECVAHTPEGYVRIACRLAEDHARLAELRATLRERVLRSPLCDAPAYAARFEAAVRSAWRDWISSEEGRSQAPAPTAGPPA